MADGSSTTVALTCEWADRVQDQWDENGRRFGDEELTLMREAAGSIHAHGLGVPAISTPDCWQRATRNLAAVPDSDTEAGWELIIRLLQRV
jgi:hypothetical protein